MASGGARGVRQILRFWFDRGIAGFRIDVAHGLYKDALLRDNPPAGDGGGPLGGPVRPARRSTTRTGPRCTGSTGTGARSRTATTRRGCCSARPGSATIGAARVVLRSTTTSCSSRSTSRSCSPASRAARAGRGRRRHMERAARPAPARSGRRPTTTSAGSRAAGAAATTPRSGSRCWCSPRCPGTLVLYYGDEIGMTDVHRAARAGQGHSWRRQPARSSRDRGRTPMQWDDSPSGGIHRARRSSAGCRPATLAARNVAAQRAGPGFGAARSAASCSGPARARGPGTRRIRAAAALRRRLAVTAGDLTARRTSRVTRSGWTPRPARCCCRVREPATRPAP